MCLDGTGEALYRRNLSRLHGELERDLAACSLRGRELSSLEEHLTIDYHLLHDLGRALHVLGALHECLEDLDVDPEVVPFEDRELGGLSALQESSYALLSGRTIDPTRSRVAADVGIPDVREESIASFG